MRLAVFFWDPGVNFISHSMKKMKDLLCKLAPFWNKVNINSLSPYMHNVQKHTLHLKQVPFCFQRLSVNDIPWLTETKVNEKKYLIIYSTLNKNFCIRRDKQNKFTCSESMTGRWWLHWSKDAYSTTLIMGYKKTNFLSLAACNFLMWYKISEAVWKNALLYSYS